MAAVASPRNSLVGLRWPGTPDGLRGRRGHYNVPYRLLASPLAPPVYDATDPGAIGGYADGDSTHVLIARVGDIYLAQPRDRDLAERVLDHRTQGEDGTDRLPVPPLPAPQTPREALQRVKERMLRETGYAVAEDEWTRHLTAWHAAVGAVLEAHPKSPCCGVATSFITAGHWDGTSPPCFCSACKAVVLALTESPRA
jgi:hypothetical protein